MSRRPRLEDVNTWRRREKTGGFVLTVVRVTTYKYWVVGTLTNNLNEATFLAALINSIGSVGSTLGFVVSTMGFNYNGACGINHALFWLSMPGLAWVVFTKVTPTSHGTSLADLAASENGSAPEEVTDGRPQDAKTGPIIREERDGLVR